ncbi:MAG TPA: SemiSWEET family transporter [Steroidobacteraceae bacterium]|nr:SemiSWEET family transporter [Steroidobacteraceae bacterium]
MGKSIRVTMSLVLLSTLVLYGCEAFMPRDTQSLLVPRLHRSEVFGLVAGFGTTFAGLPDLLGMLRRRSSAGMKPRMAAITGLFQIIWVEYGLLIASRPVIVWNTIAVLVNLLTVFAYLYFTHRERAATGVQR